MIAKPNREFSGKDKSAGPTDIPEKCVSCSCNWFQGRKGSNDRRHSQCFLPNMTARARMRQRPRAHENHRNAGMSPSEIETSNAGTFHCTWKGKKSVVSTSFKKIMKHKIMLWQKKSFVDLKPDAQNFCTSKLESNLCTHSMNISCLTCSNDRCSCTWTCSTCACACKLVLSIRAAECSGATNHMREFACRAFITNSSPDSLSQHQTIHLLNATSTSASHANRQQFAF